MSLISDLQKRIAQRTGKPTGLLSILVGCILLLSLVSSYEMDQQFREGAANATATVDRLGDSVPGFSNSTVDFNYVANGRLYSKERHISWATRRQLRVHSTFPIKYLIHDPLICRIEIPSEVKRRQGAFLSLLAVAVICLGLGSYRLRKHQKAVGP